MGSVATTHKEKYREPFAPVMPGVEFVRFNDVADLKAKFSSDVCAILRRSRSRAKAASIPVSQEFLAAARELTQSTGALLIADEIQSGMGRTGKWCAYQHYGIQPDITTLAKPIAGRSSHGSDALHGRGSARHPSRACTEPRSAAALWPVLWPSPYRHHEEEQHAAHTARSAITSATG